jgi:hypothetical protein
MIKRVVRSIELMNLSSNEPIFLIFEQKTPKSDKNVHSWQENHPNAIK